MQCIKCGMSLAVSAVHSGLTCFSCGSLFLEIKSLSVEPGKFNLKGIISKPADVFCPSDGSELALVDLNGLAVEICPTCNKVWLDKGELDRFKKKYSRKEDVPIWKKHQQQQSAGNSEPLDILEGILEFIYWLP